MVLDNELLTDVDIRISTNEHNISTLKEAKKILYNNNCIELINVEIYYLSKINHLLLELKQKYNGTNEKII